MVRRGRYAYGKARTYARRGSNFARSSYKKSYKGFGINVSPAFLLGAAIGMTSLDDKIPAQYSLFAAAMPFSGKGVGQIKGAAQGLIIGNLVQSFMKTKSFGGTATNSSFGM